MKNGKNRIILFSILAIFSALMIIGGCDHGNKPAETKEPVIEAFIKADQFPKAPEGVTYVGFKIKWTDKSGKEREKTVNAAQVQEVVLEGGVKDGTKPQIIPLKRDPANPNKIIEDTPKPVEPSTGTPDWNSLVKSGISNLKGKKYDEALNSFEKAYNIQANNSTKTYYALVKLASISIKPQTVKFMQKKIGLEKYPNKLNALVNLETWWEKQKPYPTADFTRFYPKVQEIADWYKSFNPVLKIPAYILEESKGNADALIDELYGILFGAEFDEAKRVLEGIDASKSITIDNDFLTLIGDPNAIQEEIGIEKIELKKDQVMGIIGALTVAKGGLEWVQSYSFNFKDVSIFKWNWEAGEPGEVFKSLGSYNKDQDPFNNGFFTGRNSAKMNEAKKDFVAGLDLIIKAYESVANDSNMPKNAKDTIAELGFIKEIVKEIRNAINEGRKANMLIGSNNMMTKEFSEYKIDMGKVFTYEYFKLSNLFEMNGTKPKIYPAANGKSAYMNLKLKSFMEDFVDLKNKDGNAIFNKDMEIPLTGEIGYKIINFYK